ncbi:MAG: histidine--tRNA ligase [Candidatus Margulisbacteria bacterium]|nr:histidine--tRNA ligase [Candidatus Margulisiibacteriota bacterium]
MKYTAPRGTKDILPDDSSIWQVVENVCRAVFGLYNYQEIRTPIFEPTELFARSIGDSTDIVKKEMYTFADRKGRSLTLRPEATAAVVRAGLENNLISTDNLTKLYYIGPMFRYERPQAGRQRQFNQAGIEAFGSNDPLLDAEVIQMAVKLFETLGLKELEVDVNSVGCKKCRPVYLEALKKYFQENIKHMCEDCKARFETNPLRILDCKEEPCQKYIAKAPAMVDHLDPECKDHFEKVVGWLGGLGVKFKINDRLVRGLDYYTKTAFEVVSKRLGAQNAVCGGGRYDDLVEELGGKPTPAIGFAIGLERLIEVLKSENKQQGMGHRIDLFIATIGDEARKVGFDLLTKARISGVRADTDYLGKSLKAQMKAADRLKAHYVYIIGEEELKKKSAMLKNMETADQKEVPFDQLFKDTGCDCGDDCKCSCEDDGCCD